MSLNTGIDTSEAKLLLDNPIFKLAVNELEMELLNKFKECNGSSDELVKLHLKLHALNDVVAKLHEVIIKAELNDYLTKLD